jgi:hypothetical protein
MGETLFHWLKECVLYLLFIFIVKVVRLILTISESGEIRKKTMKLVVIKVDPLNYETINPLSSALKSYRDMIYTFIE